MKDDLQRFPSRILAGLFGVFILSLAGCNRPQPQPELPGPDESTSSAEPTMPSPADPASLSGAGSAPAPAPMAPEPEPDSPSSSYTTAEVLLNDLLETIRKGDLPAFLALAGRDVATSDVERKLTNVFLTRKFRLHPSKPPAELSSTGDAKTFGINLEAPGDLAAVGDQQLQIALARDPAEGWKPVALYVPDIDAVIAEKMPPAKPAAEEGKAPVDVARNFLDAIVARDFRSAKLATDSSRLTDEKLAALFIVVEEGEFKPHDRNPLIATAAGDNGAWVIARLKSAQEESDFGIEMERSGTDSAWKIVGLNFSKLIQMAAMEAGAGDIAYAPIRTDLQGGDQLVLYFEYDEAQVNPRASKQLRIIADILKQDAKRAIHINGHTDAMGTVDYNEALSDSRAAAVREILLAHGIPANQIVTKAFGMSAPKAPNTNPDGTDNPTGRAQNRRAEVYLQF